MYKLMKNVISSGRYELKDILKKIDIMWLHGSVNDTERIELIELAQEKANPDNSQAATDEQIKAIFEKMNQMEKSIGENANAIKKLMNQEIEVTEEEEYPIWTAWDGIGLNTWKKGSKCTHNNKKWISCINNNIWEPGAVGVYDTIWKEVTDEVRDVEEADL